MEKVEIQTPIVQLRISPDYINGMEKWNLEKGNKFGLGLSNYY